MGKNTRNTILESYKSLLERQAADQITATAVIKECHIGRSTFYYHYRDVYELLDDTIRSVFADCEEAVRSGTWQDVMKTLLYTCRDNKNLVYHIYYSLEREHFGRFFNKCLMDAISEHIAGLAKERNTDAQRTETITEIVSYSAIGYIIHFLWHDMEDDIEETAGKLSVVYEELLDRML